MAELQLSVVSDPESKHQIESQIQQWDENLERLCCEQFRLRCYMASLQNGELPNPKVKTQNTLIRYNSTNFQLSVKENHCIYNCFFVSGSSHPSYTHDKRNFKQIRRLYCVVIPRVHLCKKSITVEQSPGGKRSYQEKGSSLVKKQFSIVSKILHSFLESGT